MNNTNDNITEDIEEFNSGFNASMDPSNKNKLDGGDAITTISSAWLHTKCKKCKHSFRLDDVVFIDERHDVYHNTKLLRCAEGHFFTESAEDHDVTFEYYTGILDSYKPDGNFAAYIINRENDDVSFLLAEPIGGLKRYQCGICSHTLRVNDIIVLCPCHPENPRCRLAIHWDPFRGLNCWGEWSSNKSQSHCPAFSNLLIND
jgi:hypothetical protein